ncbi:MAG: hypothetical protein PVF58_14095 [Candidatus Methanofastidiosia archaeon]|jgi:hypothetical protein
MQIKVEYLVAHQVTLQCECGHTWNKTVYPLFNVVKCQKCGAEFIPVVVIFTEELDDCEVI